MIDNHNHTFFSEDCTIPINEMIESAISKGIKHYTITDHLDLDYQDKRYTFSLDHMNRKKAIREAQKLYKDKINIYYGLECGVQPHIIEEAEKIIKEEQFDFVIASMHTTNKKDLYTQDFYKSLTPLEAYKAYINEFALCCEKMNHYSVVGHLDIVKRYDLSLNDVDLNEVKDEVCHLLKIVIDKGKGIEINTSGFNDIFQHAFPHPTILKWYKELGGSIITLGSDAHFPGKIAQHYEKAIQQIESCGFDRIMIFQNMIPNSISINEVKESLKLDRL
jgi:histidinol-phosphatase (PHP family)